MGSMWIFFSEGFRHITDLGGYDHILYLIALTVIFSVKEWKRLLILITGFTIGHSITLALSVFNIVRVDPQLIEFAIALTIFGTCLFNIILAPSGVSKSKGKLVYLLAVFVGLVHGLGFANFIGSTIRDIQSDLWEGVTLWVSFNAGIEIGQLIIVLFLFLIYFIGEFLFLLNKRDWNLVVSGGVGGIAFVMMLERIYW